MRYLQLKKKGQLRQADWATAGGKGGCNYLELRLLGNQTNAQRQSMPQFQVMAWTTVLAVRADLKLTRGTDSTLGR